MRSKHAVRKAGYTKDDVVNVTWIELPAGMGSEATRRVEQTVMEGLNLDPWTRSGLGIG